MAWISLGKLLLFVCGLFYVGYVIFTRKDDRGLRSLWSVKVILLVLLAFAASLLWTVAPLDVALSAFVKHAKLLEIAILVSLIRNVREARLSLIAFALGQTVLILTSWVMVAGFRAPWATSELIPQYRYVVYSSYLDQTLIFAGSAAVLWHLRKMLPGGHWVATGLALFAIVNNLFLQEGRTGYLATFAVLILAVVWEIPKRWRVLGISIAPLVIVCSVYISSEKLQVRVHQVITESQSYTAVGSSETSSGFRLNAWLRSVQAIVEAPVSGHGVGSWTHIVKRIEGVQGDKVFGEGQGSNPHQEFLLWGVELGALGVVLLFVLFACLCRDAINFAVPLQRATLSVVAVMLVACLFTSTLYDALTGDFFCVLLGLLLALGVRSVQPDHATPANIHPAAIK